MALDRHSVSARGFSSRVTARLGLGIGTLLATFAGTESAGAQPHSCLGIPTPAITWVLTPPSAAPGGGSVPLSWQLAAFTGAITEHQAHFGINTVLGSSDLKPAANGTHGHTFAAPNVGTFDEPETYVYIVRALHGGEQVLSPVELTLVSAGSTPPTVAWVVPPPASVLSGGQFQVQWSVSNYVDPASTNAVGWGISRLLGQTADQAGGDGVYAALVDVPVVSFPGTLFYTAFAANPIEFAFAPITPVQITLP